MFAVGDKVVCVKSSKNGIVKRGSVATVTFVFWWEGSAALPPCEAIVLREYPYPDENHPGRDAGWVSANFRKIHPCEPEFIELLNRIKPKVDA